MRRTLFALLLLGTLPGALARAATLVDLAAGSDWTAWGATANDITGSAVALGDIDGDGNRDLVLASESAALGTGRVCAFFGPLALPAARDLATDTPDLCIEGIGARSFGRSLLLADLDGDGKDDLVIGSNNARSSGSVWVFPGRDPWPATLAATDADWEVRGEDNSDDLAFATAGDLNGDGALDLVLLAHMAGGPGNGRTRAGEAYILFGPPLLWARPLHDLAVTPPGVRIYGDDGIGNRNPSVINDGDHLGFRGYAVVADVLGDGIPDLALGAVGGCGPDNLRCAGSSGTGIQDAPGEVVVLAGRRFWPAVIDLRTTTPDLVIFGAEARTSVGAVASADFNIDGKQDIVVGAFQQDWNGRGRAGSLYLVLGANALGGQRDLALVPDADGRVIGARVGATLGLRVATGDVDGDGVPDIVSGGGFDSPLARPMAGSVVVISGCQLAGSVRDLGVRPPEMEIAGADALDWLGEAPLVTGDLDGDGRDDILAGVPLAEGAGNGRNNAGEVHLVLGRPFEATCRITADAGPAANACAGTPVTLDASATVVAGCPGAPSFRWLAGTTVLRDWLADPRHALTPAVTTRYRVEARCGDCVTGTCFGAAEVTVAVDPDLVPADLGNTLRALRRGGQVDLDWGVDTLARSYSLYRSEIRGSWPAALRTGLAVAAETLADVAGPPAFYLYRAAGASCSGREGP